MGRVPMKSKWTDFYKTDYKIYIEEFEKRWEDGVATAKFISNYLNKEFPDKRKVLDIPAGIGRIAIPLSSYGYEIVAVDFSEKLIEYGRKKGIETGSNKLKFVVCDMLNLGRLQPFRPEIIINWWTSIGYHGKAYDLKFLKILNEISDKDAILFLETWHRNYILNYPVPHRWEDNGHFIEIIDSDISPFRSFVKIKHTYFKKNSNRLSKVSEFNAKIMLYDSAELVSMLGKSGWRVYDSFNNIRDGTRFLPSRDRIILVARKG